MPADVPRTGPNTRKGEKPPVMPVAATKHTAAGAEAFAAFFIRTIDWGYATTSSAYMRHYFVRACADCRGFAESIDKVDEQQHHYIGGRLLIKSSALISKPFVASAERTVGVLFDLEAYQEATATGKAIRGGPPQANLTLDVSLSWRNNSWCVVGLAAQR